MHRVDAYVRHLEHRNCSPKTIRTYKIAITAWLRDCPTPVTDTAVHAWLDAHSGTPWTRASYLSALRGYYRWAVKQNLEPHDPTADIVRPYVPESLPHPISEADLELALERSASARLTLWLTLGAYAGLRCKEIAGIHHDDLKWHQTPPILIVSNPKGRRQRSIPMHPRVVEAFEKYLTDRPVGGYLFPGGYGGRFISPGYVSQLIAEHFAACGITGTAHDLRHRFGSRLYSRTKDLRVTQHLLGHATPATTVIYTRLDLAEEAEGVNLL